jgi:hypothetical protein
LMPGSPIWKLTCATAGLKGTSNSDSTNGEIRIVFPFAAGRSTG